MFKKILVTLSTVALLAALTGCGTTVKDPATDTGTNTNLTTSGDTAHPAETPNAANTGGTVTAADVETKVNDMLKAKYPGDWKVAGTTLSKGSYTENGNFKIVDSVAEIFPDTMGVSIFVGAERVSTNIKQGNQRALSYVGSGAETVAQVMKDGKLTSTLSSGYLKVYIPLKSATATVAVMTISVPQK